MLKCFYDWIFLKADGFYVYCPFLFRVMTLKSEPLLALLCKPSLILVACREIRCLYFSTVKRSFLRRYIYSCKFIVSIIPRMYPFLIALWCYTRCNPKIMSYASNSHRRSLIMNWMCSACRTRMLVHDLLPSFLSLSRWKNFMVWDNDFGSCTTWVRSSSSKREKFY